MELDGVTANPPKLTKAVSKQGNKSTKSLQAQLSRLTNKLNEIKNKSRVPQSPMPSQKRNRAPPCKPPTNLTAQSQKQPPKKPLQSANILQAPTRKNSSWERKEIAKANQTTATPSEF
jgi:hypothetical protein